MLRYPPGLGYDAADHIAYAAGRSSTATAFPTASASTTRRRASTPSPPPRSGSASTIGLGEPLRVIQLVNAVLLVATAVLLLELARLVFPEPPPPARGSARPVRVRRARAAIGRDGAPRSRCRCSSRTLALVLAARMIVRRAWTVPSAIALGAALGAAQLVRAFSLWTFGVVVLVLVVVGGGAERRAAARAGRARS